MKLTSINEFIDKPCIYQGKFKDGVRTLFRLELDGKEHTVHPTPLMRKMIDHYKPGDLITIRKRHYSSNFRARLRMGVRFEIVKWEYFTASQKGL